MTFSHLLPSWSFTSAAVVHVWWSEESWTWKWVAKLLPKVMATRRIAGRLGQVHFVGPRPFGTGLGIGGGVAVHAGAG